MLFFALALSSLLAMEVLDVEMDTDLKKRTGVSKLSEKEKSELQAWIDSFYFRRETPLAAQTTAKERKAMLQENLQNGRYIRLTDNSTWNIRPSDIPIAQGWITPVDILISQSGDTIYPYKLTNSLTGSSVYARKVDKIPEAPQPAEPTAPTTVPRGPVVPMKPNAPTPPPPPASPSKK